MVNNLPEIQKTGVQSLGWENPLEEGMATLSSVLAWRIPMDRGAWQATVHGITKSWTRLRDDYAKLNFRKALFKTLLWQVT